MNKYLNIVLIAFFSFCSLKYDIGFALVIPIIFTYVNANSRSILLFIPLSLLSVFFLYNEYIYIVIGLYILVILFLLIVQRKHNPMINSIYVFLVNIILYTLLFYNEFQESIYLIALYAIISTIVFTIIQLFLKQSKGYFVYFEVLCVLISVFGASTIEYEFNIGFLLACFYTMYFSYNTNVYYSCVFSILVALYLYYIYQIEYGIILPFISIIYMLNSIASSFIFVIVSAVIGLIFPKYFTIIVICDVICILFEFVKNSVVSKKIKRKEVIKDGYLAGVNLLNTDVLTFCSFLDMCVSENDNSYEYYQKLDNGVNSICMNYCEKCIVKSKCYKDNQDIKNCIQDLIINSKDISYDMADSRVFSVCPYNVEIRKSAILISDRISNDNTRSKSKQVVKTLSSISNILKQFTVDNNMKEEIDYEKIYKLKRAINDNGYTLSYFNLKKSLKDDFIIELGIRGFRFEDLKEEIKNIGEKVLNEPVNVEYSYSDKNKEYFRIIPYTKCDIDYSSSNIASNRVSGDNVMINNTSDGKVIAIICDGMGKGYSASIQSKAIINKFEQLFNSSLSAYAMIQILNSYAEIKDSIDNYCTLDFVEIDRKNTKAIFYKMSAAPSYIFKANKQILKIENKRLPLGKESEIIESGYDIEYGDLIVMSSDGIFENINNERELENLINSISHLQVEKIVYQIINFVRTSQTYTDDDISLVVMKVVKQ